MGHALAIRSDNQNVAFDRNRLKQLIAERSFEVGDFVLASGERSKHYFDLKPTMMHPEGAYLCAIAFLDAISGDEVDFIGGLEMGAVPIISSMAAVGFQVSRAVPALFVRKESKLHGKSGVISGLAASETLEGKVVVVADDVTTKGGSALRAVEAFRRAGATITRAVSLLDRQQGAHELLAKHGVELSSIFTAADFL